MPSVNHRTSSLTHLLVSLALTEVILLTGCSDNVLLQAMDEPRPAQSPRARLKRSPYRAAALPTTRGYESECYPTKENGHSGQPPVTTLPMQSM